MMLIKGRIHFQSRGEASPDSLIQDDCWVRTAWYDTCEMANAAIKALQRNGWSIDQYPLFGYLYLIDKYAWKVVTIKKWDIIKPRPRIRLRNTA